MKFLTRMALCGLARHERDGKSVVLLSELPDAEELRALEDRLRTLGGELTLIGWKVPERNLDFPAHWLSGLFMLVLGGGQWARYLVFMRGRGLEGLVSRARREVLFRRPLLGGAAVLLRLAPFG